MDRSPHGVQHIQRTTVHVNSVIGSQPGIEAVRSIRITSPLREVARVAPPHAFRSLAFLRQAALGRRRRARHPTRALAGRGRGHSAQQ
eukprot:6208920-Pleurochrysis_carterae.AAC.1